MGLQDINSSEIQNPVEDTVTEIPYRFAREHNVLLTGVETQADRKTAKLCCPALPPFSIITELQRFLNTNVQFNTVGREEFDDLLRKAYSRGQSEATQMAEDLGEDVDLEQLIQDIPKATDLLEEADDAPIIQLINALFNQAIREQASDIHIEAYENNSGVRFRVDGVLKDITNFHRGFHGAVVSRLKVMAKLDIGNSEVLVPVDVEGSGFAWVCSLHVCGHAVEHRPEVRARPPNAPALDDRGEFLLSIGIDQSRRELLDLILTDTKHEVGIAGIGAFQNRDLCIAWNVLFQGHRDKRLGRIIPVMGHGVDSRFLPRPIDAEEHRFRQKRFELAPSGLLLPRSGNDRDERFGDAIRIIPGLGPVDRIVRVDARPQVLQQLFVELALRVIGGVLDVGRNGIFRRNARLLQLHPRFAQRALIPAFPH